VCVGVDLPSIVEGGWLDAPAFEIRHADSLNCLRLWTLAGC